MSGRARKNPRDPEEDQRRYDNPLTDSTKEWRKKEQNTACNQKTRRKVYPSMGEGEKVAQNGN
jgi:hypothetical protein